MRLSKQVVNALGALTVVVALVAGVMLVALPMYSQSRAMTREAAVIATTNAAHATERDQLRKDKVLLADIQAAIDSLRAEIPSAGTLDDVFEIVAEAARASGVVLESAISSPAQGWTARPDAVSVLDAPVDGAPVAEPPAGAEAGGEPAVEDPATEPAATPPAVGDVAAPSPEREVPFVIVAMVGTSAHAAAFLDALRAGPRLLAVTHAELVPQEPGLPFRLTINALAFVRTEE